MVQGGVLTSCWAQAAEISGFSGCVLYRRSGGCVKFLSGARRK